MTCSEEMEEVEEVVLAHPLKTRLIADAQIKTDRLDAFALGTLLRGNLVARAHIPRGETRARKNLLRQRLYWSRLRRHAAEPHPCLARSAA